MVEFACIGIGLLLAVSVGFESGGVWLGIGAAAPFAAAAVVEAARIPLVQAAFKVRGSLWKGLAVAMILLAGALTAENLIFGFERAFSVRIEEVRRKAQSATDAGAHVAHIERQAQSLDSRREAAERTLVALAAEEEAARSRAESDIAASGQARDQGRDDARTQLEAAQREQAAMQVRHGREQTSMRAVCNAAPERCGISALVRRHQQEAGALDARIATLGQAVLGRGAAADREREAALERRDSTLREIRARKEPVETELRSLSSEAGTLQGDLAVAQRQAASAAADAEALRRQSQMHRLALFFMGTQDDAAAMRVLSWFSILSAIVLSAAGSILAAMHFRYLSQPPVGERERPGPLTQAIRGWIARQRKRNSVVRTVEVEKVIEVPVDRVVEVEKIVEKVVEVPVDRVVEVEKIVERPVDRIVEVEKIVVKTIEVPIDRLVEVVKPELVLVPVPLEATEAERQRIIDRASAMAPVTKAA